MRRLRQRKYRVAEQACFVDGLRLVGAAVEANVPIETLIWCDALLTSDFGRNLLKATRFPTVEVDRKVFKALSDRDRPVGLAAILATDTLTSDLATFRDTRRIVALDTIADPGNLGTIIRTVDAAGADGIVLIGNTVDRFHSAVLKSSMGAAFTVPIATIDTADDLFEFASANRFDVAATSAKATVDYRELSAPERLILLMGSEKMGLSAETLSRANHTLSIPMRGTSSSLNLAVATGLLLYQYT